MELTRVVSELASDASSVKHHTKQIDEIEEDLKADLRIFAQLKNEIYDTHVSQSTVNFYFMISPKETNYYIIKSILQEIIK